MKNGVKLSFFLFVSNHASVLLKKPAGMKIQTMRFPIMLLLSFTTFTEKTVDQNTTFYNCWSGRLQGRQTKPPCSLTLKGAFGEIPKKTGNQLTVYF